MPGCIATESGAVVAYLAGYGENLTGAAQDYAELMASAPTLKAENERLTDRLEWMTSAALDLVKVLERAGMTDEMEKEIAAIRDLATLTK